MARQGDLFSLSELMSQCTPLATPPLLQRQLSDWQRRLAAFQAPLLSSDAASMVQQGQLFTGSAGLDPEHNAAHFNPLNLQPQPLSFWRWPSPGHHGAALYFVLDRPEQLTLPLLLYVGETARAEQRWKGEHDCKAYLAAYGDALHKAGLSSRLSICFWSDVPTETRARRRLERALIQRWQPPFNKETRGRWATPFQTDPG
jgi:hypothetical protein